MKIFKGAIAALAIAMAAGASAETLTKDAIIALSSAGIGDEGIIAKIKASDAKFDLTAEDMIALKNKGVSGPVIAAMLSGGESKPAPLSVDSSDPMIAHAPGVYLFAGDKMARIDATVTNQAKTGGIFGYALTGGIASMSVKAAIQNPSARTKASTSPTFYFFFDESNGPVQSGTWLAGTAATVTSPSEFTLIKLMEKEGRREARVGSMNIGGAKTGVMDKDRIPFSYALIRPGVYKVTPDAPLPKGEYGFLYSLTGGATAGAMTARIYDFSVQ